MRDPYTTLGVPKNASNADIKKAFRKLAKKYHPDSAADDPNAKAKFAQTNSAYELLRDKEKRQAYDNGEIDADGNPKFQGFDPFSGGQQQGHPGAGGHSFRPEDIFGEIFGGFRGAGGPQRTRPIQPQKGQNIEYHLRIDFADAVLGTKRRLKLNTEKTVQVTVQPGIVDGQQIRLKSQGLPGANGGPNGDALINITVRRDELFTLDGRNIRLDLPITLYEAVLGAKIRVPTLSGAVDLKIPPNSSGGSILRLKGRGVPEGKSETAGDMLVTIRIVLPEEKRADFEEAAEKWAKDAPYEVRGPRFQ